MLSFRRLRGSSTFQRTPPTTRLPTSSLLKKRRALPSPTTHRHHPAILRRAPLLQTRLFGDRHRTPQGATARAASATGTKEVCRPVSSGTPQCSEPRHAILLRSLKIRMWALT